MSQVTDRTVGANPTGFDMRMELNNIIGALETCNSGTSEPLNTVQFMYWFDTSNATYYYLKQRNHDNTAWNTILRYTVATKILELVSNGVVINGASFVNLTNNQTINGVKTFGSFPITPSSAPTENYQVANKKYVDDNAITPDATETIKGKVELATIAEVQAGTDTLKAITPAGFRAASLGQGQAWQDVTASRAYGVTYTNTTGKPIVYNISPGSGTGYVSLGVDGIVVAYSTVGVGILTSGTAIVPAGSTYRANIISGTPSLNWYELR